MRDVDRVIKVFNDTGEYYEPIDVLFFILLMKTYRLVKLLLANKYNVKLPLANKYNGKLEFNLQERRERH